MFFQLKTVIIILIVSWILTAPPPSSNVCFDMSCEIYGQLTKKYLSYIHISLRFLNVICVCLNKTIYHSLRKNFITTKKWEYIFISKVNLHSLSKKRLLFLSALSTECPHWSLGTFPGKLVSIFVLQMNDMTTN